MSAEVTYEETEYVASCKQYALGEWMERSTLHETALRTSSAASKWSLGTVGKLEWGSRRSGVVEGLVL
jgi:hypothetical protein